MPVLATAIDFGAALTKRQLAAQERERIGLLGEQFVFEAEKQKLTSAGRSDLAERVRLVSEDGSAEKGYDILTFEADGTEIHAEVKTTTRNRAGDQGFWLTFNEVERAKVDPLWRLFRAWEIDSSPQWRSQISIATGRRIFLEENFGGSSEAEARAGAVVE